MSWVKDPNVDHRTFFQRLCFNILRQGQIPRHVGFIMDGNRRFAKKNSVANIDGHMKGFDKLAETLRWCLDIGLNEVTVYVFSIENFKRPKDEVDALMKLANEKFQKMLEEKDKLNEQGVRIQIVGDWSLIPDGLKSLMAKAMILTKDNSRAKLNIAFAYTSRNEITRGVQAVNENILNGVLLAEDLTPELLSKSFQLLPSEPLDLLVRTSGETRLSDFLLWQQSEDTVLSFTPVLWPEFTIWHFLGSIFHYQVNRRSINQMKLKNQNDDALTLDSDERKTRFLRDLNQQRWRLLEEQSKFVSL